MSDRPVLTGTPNFDVLDYTRVGDWTVFEISVHRLFGLLRQKAVVVQWNAPSNRELGVSALTPKTVGYRKAVESLCCHLGREPVASVSHTSPDDVYWSWSKATL